MTKEVLDISPELAVRVCKALISCVDELGAIHQIKYGHLRETKHPVIKAKMEQDEQVRSEVIPVLLEFHDLLVQNGFDPIGELAQE
ncbi:hypothetical protein [Aliiroseovarius crassostreae]|uniref:hypothetical protein n=1 Tax=Aliiroseovarius crassostreae TaxID=154981 RepID=UPI0022053258|nr:hypothetical protein [Aliiroseovarius crassostreae]UWP99468.1 hypothetical protein K3X53_04805 [Aliiroseovarius crassostreae]